MKMMDICKDICKNKNKEEPVGKLFPSLPRNFQRINNARHTNRKGLINISYEAFMNNFKNWIQHDLKNCTNKIRIALSTMRKCHLKQIADYINEFITSQDESFLYMQWYILALDIIETKIYKASPSPIKRTIPKYRCNVKFSNKALDFINLAKIIRTKEVIDACPLSLEHSELPMVVYTLTQPVRSKIFNYQSFVSNLDVPAFLEDNNSIPCSCNQYDNSFIDKDHKHVLTGDLRIINNSKLRKLFTKGPKYREPSLIDWDQASKDIYAGIDQYIDNLSSDKGLHQSLFSEWKNTVLQRVNDKINKLKNKVKPVKHNSVFKCKDAQYNLKNLQEKFVLVPVDKASNNIAFICKRFYATVIVKELGLINNSTKKTYEKVNDKSTDIIISEHKQYLANQFKINLENKMKKLPSMYWIPKMHKDPVSFRFIIASPCCSLKPLSKDITKIFKLFFDKIQIYNNKSRLWSGVNKFWIIQNNKNILKSINKLNKRKSAKQLSTFDFSTLYTNIPHDKLLMVLGNIIDFAFKGGTRDLLCTTKTGAYWVKKNSKMNGNFYSLGSLKNAVKYLLDNSFFQVGNNIFRQIIGIPMGSDPAPFFANLFLYYYESEWLTRLKSKDHKKARKFGNVFRFIDDLIAINDGNEFSKAYKEIYPQELELKKENLTEDQATFLDLNLTINNGIINTKLYDKRDTYNFSIVRLPFKSSNLPSKMFFSTISAEILRICRATSTYEEFLALCHNLISRMLNQGADKNGTKKILQKMIARHQNEFDKYSKDITKIITDLLL